MSVCGQFWDNSGQLPDRSIHVHTIDILSCGCQVAIPLPSHFRRVDPPPLHMHTETLLHIYCRDLSRLFQMSIQVSACICKGGGSTLRNWDGSGMTT